MLRINASEYDFWYGGTNINHGVWYLGARVYKMVRGNKYYKLQLRNDIWITILPEDILQVRNYNSIKKGN